MSREVYLFHSRQPGIPQLTGGGAAGDFANILYACGVTGFGAVTLDSLTQTGGVATASASGGVNLFDGFTGLPHAVVISGSTNGWNGEYVLNAEPGMTSCTFQVPAGLPSPATGTITMKRAPAGMSRLFSSGNKEVYQFKDTGTLPGYLLVDDSNANWASIRLAETAAATVDYATMTGLCPTVAQRSGGSYWMKNYGFTNTARPFFLVIWKGGVLFGSAFSGSYPDVYELFYAGACLSRKSGDAFPGIVMGENVTYMGSPWGQNSFKDISGNGFYGQYLQRSANQVGSAIPFCKYGLSMGRTEMGGAANKDYSCWVDGMDELSGPVHIVEGDSNTVSINARRGVLPGIWDALVNTNRTTLDVLSGMSKLPGRRVILVKTLSGGGFVGVDVDGPYSLGDY